MSKQIEANPSRISFDPRDVDVQKLDEVADDRGMSRAELIRGELKAVIDEAEADIDNHADLHKPENPELKDAFESLLSLSDHPLGPRGVTVGEAVDQLYTQDCPKASVKRRLLKPLADLGFIGVTNGRLTVYRRTVEQVQQAEADAEDELDRFERAGFVGESFDLEPEHKQLLKYQRADIGVPFDLAAWAASRTLWGNGGQTA